MNGKITNGRTLAAAVACLAIALPSPGVGPAAAQEPAGGAAGGSAAGAWNALGDSLAVRIDSVFRDLDRTDSPGCALSVVRDGAIVYANGYGSANLDYELPITRESVFYLGSVSKQFTAAAILLAAERGHLSLDDDIRKHLPELPDYGEPITVRHLVHHTSGLRDYLTLGGLAGHRLVDVRTDEEVLELVARQRALNFAPGAEHLYSNTGYFLMAEIVERVTGRSLRKFAAETMFGPLGMLDTHFHDDRLHVVRNRVVGYEPAEEGPGFRMNHAWNFAQVGSGGVYSTVEDLARWDRNFGTEVVGGPGFEERMTRRGVLSSGDTLSYAFGLAVGEHRGLRTVSHGGGLAGFRSHYLRFPEAGAAVIVLCNLSSANPARRARAVADVVLGGRLGPPEGAVAGDGRRADPGAEEPPVEVEAAVLARYEGHYALPEGGVLVVERGEDGGRLLLRFGDGSPDGLTPLSDSTFRIEGPGLRATFRGDGARPSSLVVHTGGDGLVARRVETVRLSPEERALLAGTYHSEELDAAYILESGEDGLALRRPGRGPIPLTVAEGDVLLAPGLTLKLRRGPEGRVAGFELDAGRVQGIVFEREAGARS